MGILQSAAGSPLFFEISKDDRERFLRCTGAAVCKYERGETILRGGQPFPRIGILLRGKIFAARDDAAGNRCMLSHMEKNEVFGLSIALMGAVSEDISIIAETDCEALMMDAGKLIDGCSAKCDAHRLLLRNALMLLAGKNLALIRKQCHMSQHSLRGKILSYLRECAGNERKRVVEIPFRRQAFADYLGVDRSALCAELSRMKCDGLIDYRRERFTLYEPLFSWTGKP